MSLPSLPWIILTIQEVISSTGIFLFVQFLRHFLKTFKQFPAWDKALKCIAIIEPLVSLANFLIEPHLLGKWNGLLDAFSNFLFVVGLFMILITFIKYLKNSGQLLRVLKIAAIPASVFWCIGFGSTFLFGLLYDRFGIKPPHLMN